MKQLLALVSPELALPPEIVTQRFTLVVLGGMLLEGRRLSRAF